MPKNDAVYVTSVGTIFDEEATVIFLPTWNKEKNILLGK